MLHLQNSHKKKKTTTVNIFHLVCRKQYGLGMASARLLTGQNLAEVLCEQVLAYWVFQVELWQL